MTREEEIRNKADELALKYFPNEHNIWAKENIEALYAYNACIEMAKWADENPNEHNGKELLYVCQRTAERTKKDFIHKACKWLEHNYYNYGSFNKTWGETRSEFINDFHKAMEE